MRPPFFGVHPLTLAQQAARMAVLWPSFSACWRGRRGLWRGCLQPTDVSVCYTITIRYRLGGSPEVSVESPSLQPRSDGEDIPHRYPDGSLCLYLPRTGEWSSRFFIAESVVPWTSLWLYHYEVWHAVGQWLGGGVHTTSVKQVPREI